VALRAAGALARLWGRATRLPGASAARGLGSLQGSRIGRACWRIALWIMPIQMVTALAGLRGKRLEQLLDPPLPA
jgi:hypothetical protein